jgi:hypothetical protein
MMAERAHDICLFPRGKRVRLWLNFLRKYGLRSGHRPGNARPAQDEVENVVRLLLAGKPDNLDVDWQIARMKITDDYKAKYRLWAENPRVVPASSPPRIPDFKSKRFSTHAEMNAWKESLLRQFARSAPWK